MKAALLAIVLFYCYNHARSFRQIVSRKERSDIVRGNFLSEDLFHKNSLINRRNTRDQEGKRIGKIKMSSSSEPPFVDLFRFGQQRLLEDVIKNPTPKSSQLMPMSMPSIMGVVITATIFTIVLSSLAGLAKRSLKIDFQCSLSFFRAVKYPCGR